MRCNISPSALERCNEPGDWLRREIESAIDNSRNIIPLMMEGFDFGTPATMNALTGKLSELKKYNALDIPVEYFDEAMIKLRSERFLNRPLESVSLPVSDITRQITEEQKSAAIKAELVETEQLTALEWFERGYIFQEAENLDEAIRCYSEAIRLAPKFLDAYGNRGIAYILKGDADLAIDDYNKVIQINPLDEKAHLNLGTLLGNLKRYEEAEVNYRKAIKLNPSDADPYFGLGILLGNLKRYEEAEANYRKAIELNPSDAGFFNSLAGLLRINFENRLEETLSLYEKAVEIDPKNFNAYITIASISKQLGRKNSNHYAEKARQFLPENDWYNHACLESICDNFEMAFENLRKAKQDNRFDEIRSMVWEDPDLQWIRDDPRFIEIVGPKPEK